MRGNTLDGVNIRFTRRRYGKQTYTWVAAELTPAKRVKVSCNQCQMLSINGVACHETGCPNSRSRWDVDAQDWVKQRKCFECGCTVDVDYPCCNSEEWS